MKRKSISISVQKNVAARQNYNCAICLEVLPSTYNIDHCIPWAVVKNNDDDNLQALCPNCHAVKTLSDNKKIKLWKMETEIIKTFNCDCDTSYTWKGENNFNKHKKSVKHLTFVNSVLKKENEKLTQEIINWKNVFYVNNPTISSSPV